MFFSTSQDLHNLFIIEMFLNFLNLSPLTLESILNEDKIITNRGNETFTFRELISDAETTYSEHFMEYKEHLPFKTETMEILKSFDGFVCDMNGYELHGTLPAFIVRSTLISYFNNIFEESVTHIKSYSN